MEQFENALQESNKNLPATIKSMFSDKKIRERFEEILGKKASGFMSSVINVTNNNKLLKKADPGTIMSAAVIAATLDLPIDPNLGQSYIVPYAGRAQFQIGYKGFIQLAQRTGEYIRLNAVIVHENQFKSWNALTEELGADFTIEGTGEVKGYAFYFKLSNGFEKTAFFYRTQLMEHGKRYSKSFGDGPWKTHPNEMCLKTAIKQTLSKWGILSIDMQRAMKADQAIIKSENIDDPDAIEYVDAMPVDEAEPVTHEKSKIQQEYDQQAAGTEDVFDAIKKESEGGTK